VTPHMAPNAYRASPVARLCWTSGAARAQVVRMFKTNYRLLITGAPPGRAARPRPRCVGSSPPAPVARSVSAMSMRLSARIHVCAV